MGHMKERVKNTITGVEIEIKQSTLLGFDRDTGFSQTWRLNDLFHGGHQFGTRYLVVSFQIIGGRWRRRSKDA